jgi:uncharacterized protein YegP (UPF0339 family)
MKGYQFYQDVAHEWRWRLIDGNENIVATAGEGYNEKNECEKGAALFTTLGPDSPMKKIEEYDGTGSGDGPEWKYFEDKASKWRWHFQARNNKIIAACVKGFEDENAIKTEINHVKALLREIGREKGGNTYTPPATVGATSGGRFA